MGQSFNQLSTERDNGPDATTALAMPTFLAQGAAKDGDDDIIFEHREHNNLGDVENITPTDLDPEEIVISETIESANPPVEVPAP